MSTKLINWGFLGCGNITNDFLAAIRVLPQDKHKAWAIASRDLKKAQNFAQKFSIEKAYGSYQELVEDPKIDVVYVGTVNSEHYPNAKLAIEAGKNVLVEKPLGINKNQIQDLIRLAREKNVFLLEGFWTRFFPAFEKFQELLKSGSIGDVTQILLSTGAPFSAKDRINRLDLGGGSLMNFGVYAVQFSTLLFGWKPDKIVATGQLMSSGVDESSTFILSYPGGQTMTASIHTKCWMPREVHIIGTKGTLKFHCPYWAPTRLETAEGILNFELPATNDETFYPNPTGFTYEAEEVRNCLIKGLKESPRMPLEESLAVYEISDEIRRQLGVKFPADSI